MLKYKAIPKYRGKIGMSQSGLSKVTGIRIEYISRMENGKLMNPTLLTMEKLANALQIRVSDLIDDKVMTQ